MAWAAVALTVASTLMSAQNQQQAGKAAQVASEAQAQGLEYTAGLGERQAGQERAASQRDLLQERRKERLIQSAVQARSAASGGGALDPTVVDLSEDIAREGDFRARSDLFKGDSAAQAYENQALLRRYEAAEARRGGGIATDVADRRSLTTLVGGAGKIFGGMYNKYGGGGPKRTSTAALTNDDYLDGYA